MVISGNNLIINGTTVEAADLTNIASITSDVQTQLNSKANLASPIFTGTVTAPTFSGALSGNATSATKLTNSSGDWSGSGAIANVVGMLSWKNYGNGHAIFDASDGTAPNGTAVNNTNAQAAWSASYPTLMGWNGGQTFGVRVDSARVADSCGNAANATTATNVAWSGVTSKPTTISGYGIADLNSSVQSIRATASQYGTAKMSLSGSTLTITTI